MRPWINAEIAVRVDKSTDFGIFLNSLAAKLAFGAQAEERTTNDIVLSDRNLTRIRDLAAQTDLTTGSKHR